MKNIIKAPNAPSAIGPYSQAVESNGMLFISGQIPVNPVSGQIEGSTVAEQTRRVLTNLKEILEAAGYKIEQVVKTTCYLKDLSKFGEMNEIYAGFFKENPPARSTVEVSRLPRDVMVEIDAIAFR